MKRNRTITYIDMHPAPATEQKTTALDIVSAIVCAALLLVGALAYFDILTK